MEKQIALQIPDWVRELEDDRIAGAIVGLLFGLAWNGKSAKIPNLKEYVAKKYDDMSEDEIETIAELLIEHKIAA